MEDIKHLINYNITIAEELNTNKENGIKRLEERIDKVPEQWKQRTKKFIDTVKANIQERCDYIIQLKELGIFAQNNMDKDDLETSLAVIIGQLLVLDDKDITACDMYEGFMDEEI